MKMLKAKEMAAVLTELKAARDAARKTIDGIFKRHKVLENDAEFAELFFQSVASEIIGFAMSADWSLEETVEKFRAQWAAVELIEEMKIS